MSRIHVPRVILGGLLAGLIINVSEFLLHDVVMKTQFDAGMQALGRPVPEGGRVIAVWVLWAFAAGIAAVWLYAAIRPRYGPGPATAARAGVAMWFFSHLFAAIAMWNMGLFPIHGPALVWTLAESVLAAIAGAWVYRESPA